MKLRLGALAQRLMLRSPGTQPGEFRLDRANMVRRLMMGVFSLLAFRAVLLHLFPSHLAALHQLVSNQYQHTIELAPYRGPIYDHRGDPLAISVKRPSLAINPHVFHPTPAQLSRLARTLKLPQSTLKKLIGRHSYFAWIARQLDPKVADDAMNLGVEGLVQISEPARFYPAGMAAAHMIGFVGLDNAGLSGLERQYDHELKGEATTIVAGKDARGQDIFSQSDTAAPERTGKTLYLTLDRVIQEIAEDELAAGLKAANGKRGFVIISDPHTGRLLAVANSPGFDPNGSRRMTIAQTRNGAVLDTFEPGSVVKPFVIATAIERHTTTPDEMHECDKGALRIGKHTIHDVHSAAMLSTADALIRSSNICTYKIASQMGKEATSQALQNFGLASRASLLGLPGETGGHISDWRKWANIRFANVAFGHGFVVTGLELVQAMGAIANGGQLFRPTLVERVVQSDGIVTTSPPSQEAHDVISPTTARTMRGLLHRVVTDPHGTGRFAATPDYSVAGKTGTAQKVESGRRGYAKGKYIASFIGFAPVEDPHLVIYVLIDEPAERVYSGALAAAPIFAKVAERSLKYLNVAPDLTPVATPGSLTRPKVAESPEHGKDGRKL